MAHTLPRVMISAPWKSSGKTLLTVGLAGALTQHGVRVRTFKKGMDFIDPKWHAAATGRAAHNLDFFVMGREAVREIFIREADPDGVAIIEGNHGLFDGQDLEGSDCSAAMAELLEAPVLLVVDCSGLARGVAPLVYGQCNFPGGERIAGVILNNVATPRQEKRLRAALDRYCRVVVVGVLPPEPSVFIDERHLGLVPAGERDGVPEQVAAMIRHVQRHVDLDLVLALARGAPSLVSGPTNPAAPSVVTSRIRVAYAADRAFHFYYPENLQALHAAGVDLVPVDLLTDPQLPSGVRGLFIGGGFPEVFMESLAANAGLTGQIRALSQQGFPIYAECGGLMYLSQQIRWGERAVPMAGVLPVEITMEKRPQGHGYMTLQATGNLPWPPMGQEIHCHEFHYSRISKMGEGISFAYRVARGTGVDGEHDGVLFRNVLASYAHIHAASAHEWAPFLRKFWEKGTVFT